MKKNIAFTVTEILITIGILAVVIGAVVGVVNNGERQKREFLGTYNMLVPKLTDMAGYATTLSDRAASSGSTWWADSASLSGLDCEEGTPSECLREAFIEVAKVMKEADRPSDAGFSEGGQVSQALTSIFGEHGGFDIEDMSFAEMNEGAILGFLYTDSECNTMLTGRNGEKIRSCGVIVVDVNGNLPPNRMFVLAGEGEAQPNANLAYDRYIVAVTPTSVEQTELINQAAGCAAGTVFRDGVCVESKQCPLSPSVRAYAEALVDNNDEESITLYYPLGQSEGNCYSARCRDGLRPNANYECNPVCRPLMDADGNIIAETQLSGGLTLDEGGILDPLESNTKECCIPISDKDEFKAIGHNSTRTYCLVNDIDLQGGNWVPLRDFKGKLYGNGHVIRNIQIIKDADEKIVDGESAGHTNARGLFAQINGGMVKDLELKEIKYIDDNNDAKKPKNWAIGGLSAKISGSTIIENVVTDGQIRSDGIHSTTDNNSKYNYSGVVGEIESGSGSGSPTLKNIINNVNLDIYDGGIAHRGVAVIGGILGRIPTVSASVSFAINNGYIKSKSRGININQGGIAGEPSGATIEQSINNGGMETNFIVSYSNLKGFFGGFSGQYGTIKKSINNAILPAVPNSTRYTVTINSICGGSCINNANNEYLNGVQENNNATPLDNSRMPPRFFNGWENLLASENTYITKNPGMWAYVPSVKDGAYEINNIALRWQCRPYRENGLDCCMPSYATWEENIPTCSVNPPAVIGGGSVNGGDEDAEGSSSAPTPPAPTPSPYEGY